MMNVEIQFRNVAKCGCVYCRMNLGEFEDTIAINVCDSGLLEGFLPAAHWLLSIDV